MELEGGDVACVAFEGDDLCGSRESVPGILRWRAGRRTGVEEVPFISYILTFL